MQVEILDTKNEFENTIRKSTLMDVLVELAKLDKNATITEAKLLIHKMLGKGES